MQYQFKEKADNFVRITEILAKMDKKIDQLQFLNTLRESLNEKDLDKLISLYRKLLPGEKE